MSTYPRKLKYATAGLALGVLVTGCATSPTVERYVPPPIGATYVIERKDTGSFGATAAKVPFKFVQHTWQGQTVNAYENPMGALYTRPEGGWIGVFVGGKPMVTWDPPLNWDWPISVGKSWTKTYRVTNHARKQTISYDASQKVESYEEIKVPAGTFKAFRISNKTTLGDENVSWYSPELGIFVKNSQRRTEKHPAGAGTREDELVSQTIRP